MMQAAVSVRRLGAFGWNLVLVWACAQAADLYVSTSGNDANPGTAAQPFRTITFAYTRAAAGVTIHVAPGVYTDYSSGWGIHLGASGTAASPIVLYSDVPGGAIIDGQNVTNRNQGFYIDGNYNQVDGFEIRNAPHGGIAVYGNGNQILNNHIHHNGNPAAADTNGRDGVYSDQNTSGNIYAGNLIDHNGRSGSNLDHGLYLCGKNELVLNNIMWANSASGLQVAGYSTVSNLKVYNNVMAWNGTSGIILWMDLSGVEIKNNIVYENGHYGLGSCAATGSGVVVANNLFYGNASGNLDFVGEGSTYTYSQTGNLLVAPGLVNETASGFDPHLATGSPAIGAGLNLSAVFTTDRGGAVRPATGTWDLGPYVQATTNIAPVLPTVAVSATKPEASRVGPTNGQVTITRSGSTSSALTISWSLAGTASNGVDYGLLGSSLTIPAGAASATLSVTPEPSTSLVGSKTVVLSLRSDPAYALGATHAATVTIAGNQVRCSIANVPGSSVRITWGGATGKAHRVAYKNVLTDPTWRDLSGLITATGPTSSYTETNASTRTQRYYLVYQTD